MLLMLLSMLLRLLMSPQQFVSHSLVTDIPMNATLSSSVVVLRSNGRAKLLYKSKENVTNVASSFAKITEVKIIL